MNKKKLIPIIFLAIGVIMILISVIFHPPIGRGPLVGRDFEVDSFTGVNIGGSYQVIWRESEEFAVRVETQENLFRNLSVTVENDTLRIRQNRGFQLVSFGSTRPSRIYIYSPSLASAHFSGSVRTENWDPIEGDAFSLQSSGAATIDLVVNTDELNVNTSGSARVTIEANVNTLNIDSSGAGTFTLAGTTNTLDISISGSGRVHAQDLQATSANITISGAGNADVTVSDYLDVRISGSGRVTYEGMPRVAQSISGAGRVTQR